MEELRWDLDYLVNLNILEATDKEKYKIVDKRKMSYLIEKFAKDVNDQVSINLKFNVNKD